jgi:hypothetical protein
MVKWWAYVLVLKSSETGVDPEVLSVALSRAVADEEALLLRQDYRAQGLVEEDYTLSIVRVPLVR